MTEPSNIIDLSSSIALDTFALKMLKPGTDKPTGWVITLAGPEHPKTLAYRDAKRRDGLQRQARIEMAQANNRKIKAEERSPDEVDRDTAAFIASRIVTWSPEIKIGDEVYPFSDENVLKVLLRPAMAGYLQQIVECLNAEGSFMPGSAT